MTEYKLRYLEMIQNIIDRMAKNSFTIKGWVITLVSAILILANTTNQLKILSLTYLPILLFWLLDSYYLALERKYRNLYNHVLSTPDANLTYTLEGIDNDNSTWHAAFWSSSILSFYLLFLLIDFFVCVIIL